MESRYLDLVARLLEKDAMTGNRTGIPAIRSFGHMLKCSLCNEGFPLLTTKRIFWRGVFEELMWFLRGQTDVTILQNKGVHIWDGNTSREFLDARGLGSRAEGDAGPIYGFQWRHFGAAYRGAEGAKGAEGAEGADQLKRAIEELIARPDSRRILISAWNPPDLDRMALPPCHVGMQFFVDVETAKLSLSVWCRSQDIFLGTPFNIASYALLCHIVAHACGFGVGDLVLFMGDVHLYATHLDAAREQLSRGSSSSSNARPFPRLVITKEPPPRRADDIVAWIESLDFDRDVKLIGYDPLPAIKAPMAV